MHISIRDEGEDYVHVEFAPQRDDHISVAGFGEEGGIQIGFSLYAHEARRLIRLLTPVANREAASVANISPAERT